MKTPIFLKSLWTQLSNKNQVWCNQMSQSCHIMYSGEHESSRIGLIFDCTAGEGSRKQKKLWSVSVLLHCCLFDSKSFLPSTHGTTFQFKSLHSIQFLTLSNLLILILPLTDASFGLRPHFCFRWFVLFTLLPPFFAILKRRVSRLA